MNSLPSSLKRLNIASRFFSHPLDHLPPSVTCLMLPNEFTVTQPLHNLPPAITKLKILGAYDYPLQFNKNPLLTHIQLGHDFNQPLGNLPSTLTHLSFGARFDQLVDELPDNITHLTFGLDFNQNVDFLPSSITHLIFSFDFNQSVDLLPPNISHLFFGYCFNHAVQHLPPKLTHLSFGFSFNQDINTLPSSITHLKLGIQYERKIRNLPSSLHSFYFTWFADPSLSLLSTLLTFPPSLKDIRLTLISAKDNTELKHDEFQKVHATRLDDDLFGDPHEYALEVRINFVSKRLVVDWMSIQSFVDYEISNYNKFKD